MTDQDRNMDSVRTSFAYFNARRIGLPVEQALAATRDWAQNCSRLSAQSKADEVYREDRFDLSEMPEQLSEDSLLLTAHFSVYTSLLIAVGKRYQRPISVIIGSHPQSFVDTLRRTCARANVDADAIRSGMRMLRQIKQAKEQGRIISAMFDVPWHRDKEAAHHYETYPFGAGRIVASEAIFDLARRVDMRTHLTLCGGSAPDHRVRFIQDASQSQCFEELRLAAEAAPSQFERLCELHAYYEVGATLDEATVFETEGRTFVKSLYTLIIFIIEVARKQAKRTSWGEVGKPRASTPLPNQLSRRARTTATRGELRACGVRQSGQICRGQVMCPRKWTTCSP